MKRWILAAVVVSACSNNMNRLPDDEPCDPSGVGQIHSDEFVRPIQRSLETLRLAADHVSQCTGFVPANLGPGADDDALFNACRAKNPTADCALACLSNGFSEVSVDRANRLANYVRDFPQLVLRKPECEQWLDQPHKLLDCLNDSESPDLRGIGMIAGSSFETLRGVELTARINPSLEVTVAGEYQPEGCGLGESWGTTVRNTSL